MARSNSFWRSPLLYIAVVLVAVIMAISLHLTYIFQAFSFSSEANAPTIASKNIVFTSTLKSPKRFDFVVFKNDFQVGAAAVWVFRLCGIGGDSVEIRNGDLYVNNKLADTLFSLSHSYVVQTKDTAGLSPGSLDITAIDSGEVLITYPDRLLKQKRISVQRYIAPADRADAYIERIFRQPWNADHFGPVAVPNGYYFLLGDNRSNAMDSRFIGFVPEKNFRGTVLNY